MQTPYQLAQSIEEVSLNAWPATRRIVYDGWLLRYAGGYSRRNNSVNALYPGHLPLAKKIAASEAVYRRWQLPPTFRLTPFVQPPHLDSALAQAGYRPVSPTSVQLCSLADLPVPAPAPLVNAVYEDSPGVAWLDAYCQMNNVSPARRFALAEILAHIPYQTRFILLRVAGRPAACGLGVFDGRYAGLFDVVTASAQRGQGLGRRLVVNLLRWGRAQGAAYAYLQVVVGNTAALALYNRLGFREIYQYWYRVKDV